MKYCLIYSYIDRETEDDVRNFMFDDSIKNLESYVDYMKNSDDVTCFHAYIMKCSNIKDIFFE